MTEELPMTVIAFLEGSLVAFYAVQNPSTAELMLVARLVDGKGDDLALLLEREALAQFAHDILAKLEN